MLDCRTPIVMGQTHWQHTEETCYDLLDLHTLSLLINGTAKWFAKARDLLYNIELVSNLNNIWNEFSVVLSPPIRVH